MDFPTDYAKTDRQLKGSLKGETILMVGTAPSLNELDLHAIGDIPTLSCNRILTHGQLTPTYLLIADRRPYWPELTAGHLADYADKGKLLLSTTLFDKKINCGGIPPMRVPRFKWHPWRVGVCSTPINWDTFAKPLCSFASVGGPMLQAAVILGAKRIGIIGIDMVAPKRGSMHCYPDGGDRTHATLQPDGTMGPLPTMKRFAEAKLALESMGIEIQNLSPAVDTPFSKVFGNGEYEPFLANTITEVPDDEDEIA